MFLQLPEDHLDKPTWSDTQLRHLMHRQPIRHLPVSFKDTVDTQIADMLQNGVIQHT